jgi:hypothetical protein
VERQQTEYVFKVEGVSLDTLPLERVCTYLGGLGELLGNAKNVHVAALQTGSLVIVARVDPPAVTRVRERLADASRGEAGGALAARRKLDLLLADDNASGRLTEDADGRVVIPFPGVTGRVGELPAFWQAGDLRGELVRLEGEDDTKHGTLAGVTGVSKFRCGAELAKGLRHHMWETVQMTGRGRWRRSGDGAWLLVDFDAQGFELLDKEPIARTFARVRSNGGFGLQPGAIAELEQLRDA